MATQELLGICKLPFSYLSFGPKNPIRIRKLIRDFKNRVFQREWPVNFISVAVSSDKFARFFSPDENWEVDGFRTLKAVSLEKNAIEVLDGCQRIHATLQIHSRGAKARKEHWWTAYVYLKGLCYYPDALVYILRRIGK